jgi:hypothetical protein
VPVVHAEDESVSRPLQPITGAGTGPRDGAVVHVKLLADTVTLPCHFFATVKFPGSFIACA